MPSEQRMVLCDHCGKKTVHIVRRVNHILHLLLLVFTFGFWVFVWFLLAAFCPKPECTVCGTRSKKPSAFQIFTLLVAAVVFLFIAVGFFLSGIDHGPQLKVPDVTVRYEPRDPDPVRVAAPERVEVKPPTGSNVIREASGKGWSVKVEYE